jgi:hypothetical protein
MLTTFGGRPLLYALALSGCAAATDREEGGAATCEPATGLAESTQPLIDGSRDASYLALSANERAAIGRIEPLDTPSLCSGVRIAPGVALSARHCAQLFPATFHDAAGNEQRVTAWLPHPELDIALARLGPSRCTVEATLPLAEPDEIPEHLSRATLAGYGLTATNQTENLDFLVEQVVSMDARGVVVDGFGRSGACVGDSGGPLLIRDRSGQVAVLGVLSKGDASCVGQDEYLRVDGLLEWVRGFTDLPERRAACGSIDTRGRCFEEQAVWCENGRLQAAACSRGEACGFAPELAGFRCSMAPRCAGDHFGRCVSRAALRCDENGASRSACQSDGMHCGYDHQSGMAICI